MRPKERIPIFLKLVDREKLAIRWNMDSYIGELPGEKDAWEKVPDQRYGQFLINSGLLPDNFDIWMDEETDILLDQGIEAREFLLWGSRYDKNMNPLKEIKYSLIKNMDTEHIENILKGNWTKHPLFLETFRKELAIRKINPCKEITTRGVAPKGYQVYIDKEGNIYPQKKYKASYKKKGKLT
jgi:hypothetical protein